MNDDNNNAVTQETNASCDEIILKAARQLGKIIKSDKRLISLESAKKDYETDSTVLKLMSEYQASQKALMSLYGDEENSAMYDKINSRMNEIYDEIASSEAYKRYEAAQKIVNGLMEKVNSAITEEVSGGKCTHNCSSCSGCH